MDKEKEIRKWEHLFGSGAIDKALDEIESYCELDIRYMGICNIEDCEDCQHNKN